MMKKFAYLLIFIGLVLMYGCSQIQKVTDVITNPSARELYAREFDKDDINFQKWQSELEAARTNNLQVELPAVVKGVFNAQGEFAIGYTVALERGEELLVDISTSVDSSVVFVDVFPYANDSVVESKPAVSSEWKSKRLNFPIKSSGTYKVVIQSALNNSGSYAYKLYTQPTLAFPVAGKGNEAIQSFWGAVRDGGRRSHEGLDIFSSRGTPVVAATDGFVSFTGERGLGGKQVWLRNGIFGYSLYYAHLDSIATNTGTRVKVGDTLGYVGNTGNAKTTSPHLHFGIYSTGGAINPLPFIKQQTVPEDAIAATANSGITRLRQNQLRLGPKVSYEKVAILNSKDTLKILGKIKDWYHVKSDENLEGFMHESLISIQ